MDQQARRVTEIGDRIAEANGLVDDFTWRFIVVKDDNENETGVALPDGKVNISSQGLTYFSLKRRS